MKEKHTVKYLWSHRWTYSRALAPISPLGIFDLKSQQRGRSYSLLIKKQCCVFSSWLPLPGVACPSSLTLSLSLTVPFLFGWQPVTPCASKIHWSCANICQSARDQRAERGTFCRPVRSCQRLLLTWRKMFVVAQRTASDAVGAHFFSFFRLFLIIVLMLFVEEEEFRWPARLVTFSIHYLSEEATGFMKWVTHMHMSLA